MNIQQALGKANYLIGSIQEDAASQSFVEVPEIENPSLHGLESRRTLENLESLGATLNEQANWIDDLREHVVQILLRPLVDEEAEAEVTGEEYADSTQIQDALMAYTLVLRAAISDRQDALSGLTNERTRYETGFAERQAREGEGPAPEMLLKLLAERKAGQPAEALGSFRGIISELRELATKLRHSAADGSHRAEVELGIVQKQIKSTQDQLNEQNKAASALDQELDRFTSAMNARIEYYKQLQALSDTVASEERPEDQHVESMLESMIVEEGVLRNKIDAAQSKHRYREYPSPLRKLKGQY